VGTPYKVSLRGDDIEAECFQTGFEASAGGDDFAAIVGQPGDVVDRGGGGGDREGVAIVGVFDLDQLVDDVWLSDQIAESESGEAIRFGQAAADQNFFVLSDEIDAGEVGEIDVGLIDQQRAS